MYLNAFRNCTQFIDMILIQLHGFFRIYYQTSKDIYPGQELLVDYGDIYAKYLGLYEELELSDVSKAYFLSKFKRKI